MKINWKEIISYFLTDVWFLWVACFILNIITFLFLFYKIHPTDQNLALRYNTFVGVEFYGNGKSLYLIPFIGFIITLINIIIYNKLKDNKNFFSSLTVFSSLCEQIILLAAVLLLAKVN